MRPFAATLTAAAALTASGCAMTRMGGQAPLTAGTEARDAGGRTLARVQAVQHSDGIHVEVQAAGLRPGTYAVHIHQQGRCDAPGFTSAGGHWNPTSRQHGARNPQGQHQGDLPNLTVGANGAGELRYRIPNAVLSGGASPMLDGDGASFMVHARADDYVSDPAGNAGDRIGCGVFGLVSP
jgi:Cu-Zn family superoxide dismutase